MTAHQTTHSYAHNIFGNYQLGISESTLAKRLTERSPSPSPRSIVLSESIFSQPFDVTPATIRTPPTIVVEEPSTKSISCLYCKGKRYDFTAYFHNPKFFSRPPHELLALIEESYVQKNCLQSLIFNYVVRDTQQDSMDQIWKDLQAWEMRVHTLAASIGDNDLLAELESWTSEMSRKIWDHVTELHKMELCPGRAKMLVSEFRKLWEAVWIGCVSADELAVR